MRPLDEEWQDSGRNFDAENEGEVRARKSFNPNFTSENRVRSTSPDGVKRPRRRVGEAPRYNVEESGDYSNNHQFRPNNNGYNNNRRYNNNRGGSYGGNHNYGNNRPNNYGGGYNRNNNYGNNNYNNNYGGERFYDNGDFGNGDQNSQYNSQNYGNRPQQNGGYRQGGYNNRGGYNRNPRFNGRDDNGGNRQGFRPNNNRQGFGGKGGNRRPNNNNNKQGFNKNRIITRPIEYRSIVEDPNEEIRLNKFLSNAGICSRREADELITAGVVTVNGNPVSELGTKILRGDRVMIHDQLVSPDKRVYLLLNKPKDCVTTSDDPFAKTTVMDLVKSACTERIYPVGRLDRNTTGVLLLTNDGDLAAKLTHPKYNKKKIYQVVLDKELQQEDFDKMLEGVELEDGEIKADSLNYIDEEDKKKVGIEIHSGRNRIVRRFFEALGYRVLRLDRVYFAGLTKKNLRRGQWRFLSEREVSMLRMGAFE